MAKLFSIEIVTPERTVYQGEAEAVTVPGAVGPFQVLAHHAPILSQLDVGDIRIIDQNNKEHHLATSGGFVEVKHDVMTVIVETAEEAEQINVDRAKSSFERAQERIRTVRHTEDRSKVDIARAEAALARAVNRLKIAGRFGSN